MSKPRYRWWGFVRRMIRDYPGIKQAWEDIHSQSITADLSGMPKGGGTGRTVEAIALRQLPQDDQKAYDAITKAIEITKLKDTGKERIRLIRMMYWSKKNTTAKDAALRLFISKRTAERWHGDFVRLVGFYYGFEVEFKKDGVQEPK